MKKFVFIVVGLVLTIFAHTQVNPDVQLFARMDGEIVLADGHTTEFWGFGTYTGQQPSQFLNISLPGPLLQFYKGDTVNILFLNDSPEDHTIHWHGLDVDQANDGVPTTSSVIDPQHSRLYTFVCTNAGTFNYHCHVLTTLHLSMGMYGSFIVYPNTDQDQIYTNGPSYTKEYVWMGSELNRTWTDNPTSPGAFYLYEPTDFLLNGKSGSQLNSTRVVGNKEDTIAMRLSNMGYGLIRYIFPQGSNTEIHMSDGRALPQMITNDTVEVYSGERYTVLLNPDQDLDDQVRVEYYDLRNNTLMHVNFVDLEINDSYGAIHEEKLTSLQVIGNPIKNQNLVLKSDRLQQVSLIDLKGTRLGTYNLIKGINVIPLSFGPGVYLLHTDKNESVKVIIQ